MRVFCYVALGCTMLATLWFVIGMLWIRFHPTEEHRIAKEYAAKPFRLRAFLGMKG